MAWHIWHDQPRQPPADPSVSGVVKALMSGFVITMTNPVTIFAILAVVATFGSMQKHHDAVTIVSGIFVGSTLWWLMLSGGISLLHNHFTENRVVYINRITAVTLAVLAAGALGTGIIALL
jgi:putative LysE/RhtB family amino acid efflux pump